MKNDKYGFTPTDQCSATVIVWSQVRGSQAQQFAFWLSSLSLGQPLFYAVPKGAKIKWITLGNITEEPCFYSQPKRLCGFMLQPMLY